MNLFRKIFKLHKESVDFQCLEVGITLLLFFVSLWYVYDSRQNLVLTILALTYVAVIGIALLCSFLKQLSEFLEQYYVEKRKKREREEKYQQWQKEWEEKQGN